MRSPAKDYTGKDNHGEPKANYLSKIKAMDLPALKKETEDKIWFSAYANNNPRSDYHWQVDACYDELLRRTGDDDAYAACHARVVKSCGY